MALTPSFTVAPTINPAVITITDTSTGSDVLITDRVITLYDSSNALVGTFDFPLAIGATISITAFTQDISVDIVVNWNDVGGVSLYRTDVLFAAVGYNQAFLYNLTQAQSGNPNIIRDNRYYNNKIALIVELDSALKAISEAADLAGSEGCVSRANYISSHGNYYF